jgi:AcrR family transcriptional regulator
VPESSASSEVPGRRELRRRANTEALIAAAHRLVDKQGENFTTQDLIKEADVALQTFYRCFKGKDELFLAVVTDLITAHCESLAKRAAPLDGPVERLRFYVTDTLTAMVGSAGAAGPRFITAQHYRLQQEHPSELAAANQPFALLVQRELEAARDDGLLAPADPERDAWIITRLVMSVFHYYTYAEDRAEAGGVANDVWRFCLGAVGGLLHHPSVAGGEAGGG